MGNYLNNEGILYTQEEIEAAALENDTDIDTIISDNGLTPEDLGKKESVVAQEPTTTQKKKPKKSASSTKTSLSASAGENPFGKNITTFSEDVTTDYKKQQKEKPKAKQPKKVDTNKNIFEQANKDLLVQQGLIKDDFSIETPEFKAKKAEKAQIAKEAKEAEKVQWTAKVAELDLKHNKEALGSYKEALKYSKVTAEESNRLDDFIDSQFRGATTQDMGVDAMGNPIDLNLNSTIKPFAKEIEAKRKQLQSKGTLSSYSEQDLEKAAIADWKAKEIKKIEQDKFKNYLEDNTDLSEKARSIIVNYGEKKSNAEADNFVKANIALGDVNKNQDKLFNEITSLNGKLKPKNYKFATQEEVDEENKLVSQINELSQYYKAGIEKQDMLSNQIQESAKAVDDLSLLHDMYKRDYSWAGWGEKRIKSLRGWLDTTVGSLIYLAPTGGIPGINKEEIARPFAEDKKFTEDWIVKNAPKSFNNQGTLEATLETTSELVFDFAPDLALMLMSGGSSAVAEGIAKKTGEKAATSLAKKAGGYLALDSQVAPLAVRVAGDKYLQMVNEEKYGYYKEDGTFVRPQYNDLQMILAPAAYGYTEGVFEKVTGRILKNGSKFFNTAKQLEPETWFKIGQKNAEKITEKIGYFGKAQIEEGISEQFTNLGQNATDKFLLGKNVNLLDNTGTIFKDTFLLTSVLAGVPVIGGSIIKPFMSESSSSKLADNARELAFLNKKLNDPTVSEIQKVELSKKIDGKTLESNRIVEKTVNNIGEMPATVFNSINTSVSNIANILNKANEINDSNSETKEQDLKVLESEYIASRLKLNSITRAIENIDTFNKPISAISKGKLIDLAVKRVEILSNPDLDSNTIEESKEAIDNAIAEVYKEENIDLKTVREQEFKANLAAANNLAKNQDVQIIVGEDTSDLENKTNALLKNNDISEYDVANVTEMNKKGAEGVFSGNGTFLFINKETALNNKAVSVASHEFLHKLLFKTLQNNNTKIALGQALRDHLVASNSELYLNDKVYKRLMINYGDTSLANQNEELLNIFSDALLKNEIKYNESFFVKLGGIIRRYLQDLGLISIKFDSGVDVYNFIKDYNTTIRENGELKGALKKVFEKGAGGKLITKIGEPAPITSKQSKSIEDRMDDLDSQLESGEIDIDLYESKMKALEKEEAELKRKEYEEKKAEVKKPEAKTTEKKPTKAKEDAEVSDIAAKAKAKLDAIGNDPKGFNPNNPVIYTELDKMVKAKSRNWKTAKGTIIDLTNKDKGGIDGFDLEQMTSYVTTSMIPYIAKFDPSKNNSLYGYINAQYINRMKGALKSGEVADVVFAEDISEMTKISNEEVEVKKPSLSERKRFQNILESGVFSPEVIEEIQKKILPVVRTLKSKIDEKVSLNRTVAPLIEEIRNEMGKQADIDIKKAMGGKEGGQLAKWLIANKKTVLENAPTTWLMGKDNGKTVLGGMPFAIQKRVDGRWLNYPDWIGKKVDRESVDVDLAGRTAGHEMTRRLPDVNKNVPNDAFIESIIDPATKGPLRGRKESLAKMMAEEISFDIISEDLANDGIISQALKRNQELLGAVVEKITTEEINRLVERGNIKFSITEELKGLVKLAFSDLKNLKNSEKEENLENYNKLIKAINDAEKESDPGSLSNLLNLLKVSRDIYEKISWNTIEKITGDFLRVALGKDFKVIQGITKSQYAPDVEIINKENPNTPFIAEVKKWINQRIPITSKTGNAFATLFNSGKFNRANEETQIKAKEIYDFLYNEESGSLLEKEFIKIIGSKAKNITKKAKNIKLNAEETMAFEEAYAGRRKVLNGARFFVSDDFAKILNESKAKPQDVIIIADTVFDYFNGYTQFDNFNIALDVDKLPDDLFQFTVEVQIKDGYLTTRGYLNFNPKYEEKLIGYIKGSKRNLADISKKAVNEVIAQKSEYKRSASLENNLNSFKGVNNINLVSKYVSDNNSKRISAEDSFDVLNDLVKEVENYWGVVPDNVITLMDRSIDYAFDVIENRENEGGPMMAAVNGALNLETIKNTEVQLNKFIDNNKIQTPKFSKSLDYEFNDMLERNKNVPSYEKISDVVAKRTGKKVNRLSFFVPPSADDFRGLTTYMFASSGKQGELDQQFFDANLVIPYVKGVNALDSVRQSIKRSYKELLKDFPDIKGKLEKLTPDKQFTYNQAVRVYLWQKNDIEVPGLSRTDKNKLVFFVKKNPDLMNFANALSLAGRQDGGWMKPSVTWDSDTIISDLHNITEGEGRKKWLSEFIENANAIFTPENLNKVQFIYGTDVRNQLEDSLYRMKNGKSRPEGTDAITNKWMNWINGSTAAIMFFNVRSALLQTISSTNYLNWNDNNPIAAAATFANQKQYWSDFATIINSDKMRERRSGLKSDVTQAEIANAANSTTDKAKGILSYLQKIGFTPTQAADSFSIAIGGASFYRNRVNTYLKQVDEDGNKINTLEEAEEKAWLDFSIITDQSMQSADPMYVSKQQTTSLGRLVLAFANTPLQYNRQIKKAALDLVNKRGDWKTNVSKIVYYGALQNLLFSALQSALFLPFDDEDEEAIAKMSKDEKKAYDKLVKKQEDKTANILNGMVDTVLRGSGVYGALVSTIKNVAVEYKKQEERKNFADHAQTLLALTSISPPISSKARKLYGIHRTSKFEKDVIEKRGWEVTRDGRLNLSPNYTIAGNAVMATTNIPLDRVVEKVENISEVLDNRNTVVQRTALFLGWKEWELNVKNEENEKIKTEAKAKRKEEGIEKAVKTREEKRKSEKEALLKMSPQDRMEYRRQKALDKRAKKEKERKRKMG